MSEQLLKVTGLSKSFNLKSGPFMKKKKLQAVKDVSLAIQKGETYGLVGESGCGKSTTARLISRLLQPDSGEVWFDGEEIATRNKRQLQAFRKKVQMVFQDPYASLNPRMKVRDILAEPLRIHTKLSKQDRHHRVSEILEVVGLNDYHASKYPHEFSGGQRQRIGIARALMMRPELIIADEPVSALDSSIQAQIINLLKSLQSEFQLAYLFISHDLSVVEHISDQIGVMYLGKLVESGPKEAVFSEPLHPYTQALLSSIPVPDPNIKRERIILKGDLPNPANLPSGCPFHTRCPMSMDICKEKEPVLRQREDGQWVACHLHE